MIKKNKWTLIASSIVILIPMLFGIFADKILPEEIAIHFGLDGVANGFGSPSLRRTDRGPDSHTYGALHREYSAPDSGTRLQK